MQVALYAAEKLLELGAIPVTFSDSSGHIFEPEVCLRVFACVLGCVGVFRVCVFRARARGMLVARWWRVVLTLNVGVTKNAVQSYATSFHTRKSDLSDNVVYVYSRFCFFFMTLILNFSQPSWT